MPKPAGRGKPDAPAVVVTHGLNGCKCDPNVLTIAGMLHRNGFNVLLYDIRHHGRSGGKNTSFGYYEKQDLKAVVDWAFSRLEPGGLVGTAGLSLGAATTLQHAAIDKRIAFAIADCAWEIDAADLPDCRRQRQQCREPRKRASL